MKYLHMLNVLLAIAAIGITLFTGLSYHFGTYGLHPALAVLFGALSASAGWWSAGKVGSE